MGFGTDGERFLSNQAKNTKNTPFWDNLVQCPVQSPILGTTITKGRLKKRAYVSMLEYYKS